MVKVPIFSPFLWEFLATQDCETLELLITELECNGINSVSHIKDLSQCINDPEGEPEP